MDEEIQRCLPSKRGNQPGKGRTEHLIRLNGDAADLLITECKADKADHASAAGLTGTSPLKPSKFAEDGVIHYMNGLRREFNVIGIAASGNDAPETLEITTFKALRGGEIERLPNKTILKRQDYLNFLKTSAGYGRKTEAEIVSFATSLHEFLRDHMELSEPYKPLIVSGILLALRDPAFERSYRDIPDKDDLADALHEAIKRSLR
jgi:hypothetical protein